MKNVFFDFIAQAYLPLGWRVKNTPLPETIRELERSEFDDPEQIRAVQAGGLARTVSDAFRDVPFYEEKWKDLGDLPLEVKSLEDLRRFPVITKADLQAAGKDMQSRAYSGRVFTGRTSGSTGTPLEMKFSERYMARTQAAQWRGRGWYGVKPGERTLAFWGRPFSSKKEHARSTLKNRMQNIMVLQPFDLSESELERAWRKARRFKPSFIYGYSASIAMFAKFLKNAGQEVKFPVKCVFATAEMLYKHQAELISEIFSCPVKNEFGSSEVGAFAFECPEGSLHISDENVVVEFLDDSGEPVPEGEDGRIVVTVLTNECMPLVRYDMGDVGRAVAGSCKCGRGTSLMSLKFGKTTELLRTPSGKRLSSEVFDYIALALQDKGVKGIRRFRIVQKELGLFLVQIEREETYEGLTEALFTELMKERVDSDINVRFEYVDRIGPDPSGKVRYFISEAGDR